MPGKRTWVPAAAALLAVAGSLLALATEDLTYEMAEGEWIALHVWLPSESVAAVLPAPLQPGRFVVDALERQPPGAMTDAYVIVRRGTFRLPLAGKTVDETDVLDLMIMVAVQTPPTLRQDGVDDFFLLDYATSDQLLGTLLRKAGIEVRSLEGTGESHTLPSTQQEVRAVVTMAGFEPWDIHARSEGGTHYDLGNRTWRIFFASAQQALTISLHDDFYMRAASRVTGFRENNPLERFGEWRWADRDTLLLFTTGSAHQVSPPVATPGP